MSVEKLFFTHQVDQFFYTWDKNNFANILFYKRFTSKFKQIFIKRCLVELNFTKRDDKSTYINHYNKHIYLHPKSCVAWNTFSKLNELFCSYKYCIGGIMVGVLASSAVDRGLEPRSGHTKDYKIGICCFSAKHTALRRKNTYWLARNQNNVSEWSDMSTRELLFQWVSTIKIQLGVLV
jgi:hypothetical protein